MKALLVFTLLTGIALPTIASDRPAHFQGTEITSVVQAKSILTEYNDKLAELLKSELNPTSMTEIHQLTYTLENALAKLPAATGDIKALLEEVHLGSESMDYERVKSNAAAYLQQSKLLLN